MRYEIKDENGITVVGGSMLTGMPVLMTSDSTFLRCYMVIEFILQLKT